MRRSSSVLVSFSCGTLGFVGAFTGFNWPSGEGEERGEGRGALMWVRAFQRALVRWVFVELPRKLCGEKSRWRENGSSHRRGEGEGWGAPRMIHAQV